MDIAKLTYIKITGDISVEPVTTRIPRDLDPVIYLIMGPTGAGKSAFIEAFAGKSQKLSISKDQLAGYTQTVTAYRLVNVMYAHWDGTMHPVYLIDTPGFSDSKISEIEIVNMVKKWSKDNDIHYSTGILYFTPITETRLPGSRRRTFKMLKKLLEDNSRSCSLIVITTMWDTVHNKQTQKRAESNFAQLRDETLEEFVNNPSTDVIRFMNTRNSALLAIDRKYLLNRVFPIYTTSTSPHLYQDLHDHIQNALQEKQIIELDLAQPDARSNADLRAILERNWRENHKTLTKFIDQFDNFGDLPPGCEEAAQDLCKSIIAANVCPNTKPRTLFGRWKLEPVIRVDHLSNGTVQARLSIDATDLLKDRARLALDASKRCVAKWFKHGE
ncbi:hypothetical protein BJ165DRAFT_1534082 [Panaeolus papilionaceus]|nr:hypothetical protein BJ165DRAFT_1534082 [Panaeolus papilionaceus]